MKNIIVAAILCSVIAFSGCMKKSNSSNVNAPNLIGNSSFESNGQVSFIGWTGDTATYRFVNDIPTGGGFWSLQLSPCWYPCEGYAETFVTGLKGTHNYQVSCYTKSMLGWTGKITLKKQTAAGVTTDLVTTSFTYPLWNLVYLTASNVTLNSTDKLIVHLSAGSTELTTGKVLFDMVSLKQL